MIFSSPLGFIVMSAIPLLVLLHRIRNKKKPETVSSLLVWRLIFNKPSSRLRRRIKENINLLLQILIFLLLAFAIVDPFIKNPFWMGREGKGPLVIVLDGSASMSALTEGKSRFEEAQRLAVEAVRDNRPNPTALILAGKVPRIMMPLSGDREEGLKLLSNLSPPQEEGNMADALSLAGSIIENSGEGSILLISDGAFSLSPEEEHLLDSLPLKVKLVKTGEDGNLGISGIQVRRDPFSSSLELFLSLKNTFPKERRADLKVSLEGEVVIVDQIDLLPRETKSLNLTLKIGQEFTGGKLVCSISPGDSFPLDDEAYLYLNSQDTLSALLVSQGNFYLETLFSLLPGLKTSIAHPDPQTGRVSLGEASFDIQILDNLSPQFAPSQGIAEIPGLAAPEPILPPGNYIIFGFPPYGLPAEFQGITDYPVIDSWISEHPFMESVDPSTFFIYKAARISAGTGFTPVLGQDTPLLYTYLGQGIKAAVFTFPLDLTDLPMRPSFPILISNIIQWFYPDFSSLPGKGFPAGEPVTVSLSGEENSQTKGVLSSPGGEIISLEAGSKGFIFTPRKTGFYNLSYKGTSRQQGSENNQDAGKNRIFAVNLSSAEESDIKPRFSYKPQSTGEVFSKSSSAPSGENRPWKILLVFSILVLLSELYFSLKSGDFQAPPWKLRLILTVVAVILFTVSLLDLRIPGKAVRKNLLFLLDTSQSISPLQQEAALSWIKEVSQEVEEGDTLGVVVFGSKPSLLLPPGPRGRGITLTTLPPGDSTDLTQAIQLAVSLFPREGENRLILLSDGNETRGDVKKYLHSGALAGIKIYPVPIPPLIQGKELIALSMTGPGKVTPGEPFNLTLEMDSGFAGEARIFFSRNGRYLGEDWLSVNTGRNIVSYTATIEEPGFHLFEAYAEAEEDSYLENNLFRRMIFVEGDPPILYVHQEGESAESFLKAAETQGHTFKSITPETFPETLEELFSYQCIILDNIPAYDLSLAKMEMIRQAVESGLGLILLGGDSSFGAGGYYKTPLERALPVDMDITSSLDIPNLCLVMLVDKSGSMGESVTQELQKIDLAKQAVFSAAEVLNQTHTLGILAFDARPHWAVPIIAASDLQAINSGLSSLNAGGGTILYPALEEAYRVLAGTQAAVKHIIILSDGHTEEGDFEVLAKRIHQQGITISTVAVGTDADKNLMDSLALWGRGRSYYTDDIRNVPSIFASESLKVSRRLLVEETFIPQITLGHETLKGVSQEELPPLHGFMLAYTKNQAEQIISGIEGNPLLALWQYGLGRSVAFTSDLASPWAYDWIKWDGFPRLFSQLIRWASRGAGEPGLALTVLKNSGSGEIRVNAEDSAGGFRNNLNLEARILMPRNEELILPLQQTAPGFYQGYFQTLQEGIYFITLAEKGQEDRVEEDVLSQEDLPEKGRFLKTETLSIPYPEEFLSLGSNEPLLLSLAEFSGGSVLSLSSPSGKEILESSPEKSRYNREIWQYLTLAGIVIYLFSLILRFIPLSSIYLLFIQAYSSLSRIFIGKESMTYNQLRVIIQEKKIEYEQKKPDLAYWFGSTQSEEEKLRLYIARLKRKDKP